MKSFAFVLILFFSCFAHGAGRYVDPATINLQTNAWWTGTQVQATPLSPTHLADNYGKFRMHVDWTHAKYDDAIVLPNQPGAAHLHCFLHNKSSDSFSTASTLLNGQFMGDGGNVIGSSWWVPCMVDISDNSLVEYGLVHDVNAPGQLINDGALIYQERNYARSKLPAVPWFPNGLKMLSGNSSAISAQWKNPNSATISHTFQCKYSDGTYSAKQATIPFCPQGALLKQELNFPSCWDGENLDSANHKDHLKWVANWYCQEWAGGAVRATGLAGTIIPATTYLQNSAGKIYYTLATVTLPATGAVNVNVKAYAHGLTSNMSGAVGLSISSTKPDGSAQTAIPGISSITNVSVSGVTKDWKDIPKLFITWATFVSKPEGNANWRLVSDSDLATPGASMHGDAFEVSTQPYGQMISDNCFSANNDCSMGLLGGGLKLKVFNHSQNLH